MMTRNDNTTPKFKIGDRVIVNEPAQHRGKTSIVEKVSGENGSEHLYKLGISMGYFFEDWLSLVEPKFKIGDKAIVDGHPEEMFNGATVEIIELNADITRDGMHRIKLANGQELSLQECFLMKKFRDEVQADCPECHLCRGSGKRVMFNKSVECDCQIC